MRKLLQVAVLAAIILLALNRQRIFVRDPFGKVTRNGVAVSGGRVYINYSNDVLVEEPAQRRDDHAEKLTYMVQHWNRFPGVPRALTCLCGLVCWTDASRALMSPLGGVGYSPNVTMTQRLVTFNDSSHNAISVTLR